MQKYIENKLFSEITERLSEKFGKTVQVVSNEILSGGCINNAGKLETNVGTFFVKWNNQCASDLFLREAESLRELSKVNNPYIIIPEVIDSKELGETPAFLILEYLEPGRNLSGDMDERLGKGLALIHQHNASRFGFYNANYCGATIQNNTWNDDWIEFFGTQRLKYILNLIQHKRHMPESQMIIYENLILKLPQIIPNNSIPALIHGDLWSGNYLFTTFAPALIDPAAYYADREMEMGIMSMFGGFSARFWDAYNSIYPLKKDWKSRNKIYQLYHVLNHYYLFGGGYGQQAVQIAKYYIA